MGRLGAENKFPADYQRPRISSAKSRRLEQMCADLRKAISSSGKVILLAGIAGIVSPAVGTFAQTHWASALIAPVPGPNLSPSRQATRGTPMLLFHSMSFPVL